ncbi:MAG: hypothetical protein IPM16_00235 [Chloroflexi bacterium]|nr:hypothetical protein [Chloroflexota bacterium]
MTDPIEIRFGTNDETFLSLQIVGRAVPGSDDYWDGNSLVAHAEVKVEGLSGKLTGVLRSEEILRFGEQLQHGYETLSGEVTFTTMEGWIEFVVRFLRAGSVVVEGVVTPDLALRSRLQFDLGLDQSYLPAVLAQIRQVVKRFPVVGRAR